MKIKLDIPVTGSCTLDRRNSIEIQEFAQLSGFFPPGSLCLFYNDEYDTYGVKRIIVLYNEINGCLSCAYWLS